MKVFKKIISIILILSTLLTFSSCFFYKNNPFKSSSDADSQATSSQQDLDEIWADFPNPAKNWGNTDITLLGYLGDLEYDTCQIATDSKTGDLVNDAVYDRNYRIAKNFGVRITVLVPNSANSLLNIVQGAYISGSNDFQGIVAPMSTLATMAYSNLLYDLNSLENPYLNFNNPWWDQDLISHTAVNRKFYFATGDALLSDEESVYVVFCNEDIIENNPDLSEYGNIYDIAIEGKWTIDLMYEMMQKVQSPSSNTEMSPFSPYIWGMTGQAGDFSMFLESFGYGLTEMTSVENYDNVPRLRIYSQENGNAFEKMSQIFYHEQYTAITQHYHAENSVKRSVFSVGKALFMPEQIGYIETDTFKYSNINMGVLPMPKINEEKQGYLSANYVQECAAVAIPLTCKGEDLDKTCYALEAMGYLGRELVSPAYKKNLIQTLSHLTNDPHKAESILNLVFENRRYDIGAIYNFNNGEAYYGLSSFYTNIVQTRGNSNLENEYSIMKNIYQRGIDVFVNKCYYDTVINPPQILPLEGYVPTITPEPEPKPEPEPEPEPDPDPEPINGVLISKDMDYKYPTNQQGTHGVRGYIGNLTDGIMPNEIFPYVDMDNSGWFGLFKNEDAPLEQNVPDAVGEFMFDFGTSKSITDVRLWIGSIQHDMFHVYKPVSIVVETSEDGKNWNNTTELMPETDDDLYWASAKFNNISARYVVIRVHILPQWWSYWAFIGEIEIYAESESKPEPQKESVLVSSGMDYTHPTNEEGTNGPRGYIGDLTDGFTPEALYPTEYTDKDNKGWFGIFCNYGVPLEQNAPEGYGEFIFDLSKNQELSKVRVWIGSLIDGDYRVYKPRITVSYSSDNKNWSSETNLEPETAYEDCYWAETDLSGKEGRYVRFTVYISNYDWSYWAMLGEIEIYALKAIE